MDAMHLGDVNPIGHLFVEIVKLIAELVDYGEVAVDDGVEQRVCQVVGLGTAYTSASMAQSIANGVPAIAWSLLKSQQHALLEEHANLFREYMVFGIAHASHQKQVIAVLFKFSALMNVYDIFHGQGVQTKSLANFAD